MTVMEWPVAATVPTVEAKPNTMAGGNEVILKRVMRIMQALPVPTQNAAASGLPPNAPIPSKASEAMTIPVQFDSTDLIKPALPPPHAKNDAQAINVTQTGMGRTVAVRYVSIPPRRPMLTVRDQYLLMRDVLLKLVL